MRPGDVAVVKEHARGLIATTNHELAITLLRGPRERAPHAFDVRLRAG
jgi:hypothetical protein